MPDTKLIAEMQQQIAFQEQMLDSLNTTAIKQQAHLARLERSLELIAKQLKDLRYDLSHGSESLAADGKPPHY